MTYRTYKTYSIELSKAFGWPSPEHQKALGRPAVLALY